MDHGEEYDFVRAIVESCVPVTLSPEEIEEASCNDEELSIENFVKSGSWDPCTLTSNVQVKEELRTYGERFPQGGEVGT